MNKDVSIDKEQKLFVIPSGDGYSCRGFDSLFLELGQLAAKLGLPAPKAEDKGTLFQYREYQAALAVAAHRGGIKETWYHASTPRAVREVLERVMESRTRVRIHLGDTVTGCSWMEEYDVVGRIGRSTGITKIPLLVAEGEDGGPGLLDHCIVRIQNARTGADLYRHPSYHTPEMWIKYTDEVPQYPVAVEVAGKGTVARFKDSTRAQRWVEFMEGHRMSPR